MAIQMRRGQLADYDESKMLAGEWGIAIDNDSDNQKAFIAFAPGVSKQVMMVEDAQTQIAEAIILATKEAEAWAHGNSFNVIDYYSGDGIAKTYTLTFTPSSIQGVYVNNTATSAYTRSGKVITFTTAPASGDHNIRVEYTVNTATDNAQYYKNQASSSASSASGSATSAANSATESQSYAKGGTNSRTGENTDNAKYYKEQAGTSAGNASNSASAASASATEAQSYAKGGTSSRTGEDTDNAKYYKEQAATSATNAASSETNAANSAAGASGSASTASVAATNAETSANNASSSATSARISKEAAEAIAQTISQMSGISGTMRINGVLYATYHYVENGIPYTRISEVVEGE